MAMCKDVMVTLLSLIEKEMKRRIEHSYFESESDKWSKFDDYIREIRLTINRGGIKWENLLMKSCGELQ